MRLLQREYSQELPTLEMMVVRKRYANIKRILIKQQTKKNAAIATNIVKVSSAEN